jgi:sulfate/thiosulfate transport system permease protein
MTRVQRQPPADSNIGLQMPSRPARTPSGPGLLRRLWPAVMVTLTLLVVGLFLVLPLISVFAAALGKGLGQYLSAVRSDDTVSAILLTLLTVCVAVPLNTIFGVAAAWAVTKFRFPGRNLLLTLIDLPLAISPVISGLVYVLIFGRQGFLGPWLQAHDLKVIFAPPGIVLATTFVTFAYVARELIPVMQAQGKDDEEAALTLGATGWQTFMRITLPNIRWALTYGVIMCNARAMGEFGAVSVVSGHIRGLTNTMPLQIEILYNEYNTTAAFAVASLLALMALLTLGVKAIVEARSPKIERR